MPKLEQGFDPEARKRLREELAAVDAESARPLRAIVAGTATDEDRTRLADLEARAQALREQLQAV